MTSDNSDSARASLIKTRRGTWIDKSLLPLAHQECLEILRAATEAVGEEVVKMARGDTRPLEKEPPASNRYYLWGYHTPVRDALDTLRKELLKYRPPEEEKARQLAREARESARMCGCCSRELLACEPVYYGAKVYVGLLPLLRKRQIWEACYARTVLCGSCAGVVILGERRRGNATLRVLRAPHGLTPGAFGAGERVLLQRLQAGL